MKKVLSLLLALVIVVCCCFSAPFVIKSKAATVDELSFKLNEDAQSYYVSDCDTGASGEIVIPNTYNGLPVTSIGYETFENCNSITSVTIPYSVTSICDKAFAYCNSITSITIPDSVTSIGDDAFWDCERLINIAIDDSVMSIGENAFYNTAYYNDSNNWESGVLYIGNHLIEAEFSLSGIYIINEGTKCIADRAFGWERRSIHSNEFTEVTSIIIPNTVIYIGDYAFSGCQSLTNITVPNSVTGIGNNAFEHCCSLTSVAIPNSVTSIGVEAFYGCYNLADITISDSVTSIGYDAFNGTGYYNCSSNWINDVLYIDNHLIKARDSLSGDYVIKEGTRTIAPDSFGDLYADDSYKGCYNLTSITIPDSVVTIGYAAFAFCEKLKKVIIGNGVTSIKGYAFYYCESLTSLKMGNSVTSIGDYAFYNCELIGSITIPSSLKKVGEYAFDGCYYIDVYITDLTAWYNIDFCSKESNPLYWGNSLYLDNELVTEITIPKEVTVIKKYAFIHCVNLEKVIISDGITSIGEYAFNGCSSLTSVTIPNSVTSIGFSAFRACPSLTSITIPDSVTSIGSSAFSDCTFLTSITILDGVTSIGYSAFSGCTSLTSITIPDSVTSIDEYAFYGCTSLTSITIPNSVTSIGEYAFYGCTSLTSITIPNSVTSIGEYAFYGCTSLTSITIPNSVTSIGEYAFSGCTSLTSITIPDSVTSIGEYAFNGCKYLTSVNISDLVAWCNINFGSRSANPLWYAEKLYLNGKQVTELVIPDGVTSIAYAFCNCTSLTSVTIPNSVTSIGYSAFESCTSLTSITIPDSVTSIGYYAFYNCSALKYVFYTGSSTDWSNTNISGYNTDLFLPRFHYNATGHSHSCSIESAPTEQENGKAIDTCPVCGFINGEEDIVYINDYITAVDTKNAVVDATTNTLLLDMSACKDINEAVVKMDGYTLTTTPTSSYGFIGTGSKVQVADSTGTQVAEYTLVVRGDVNGDSVCDSIDLMLIELARYESNNVTLEGAYFAAANLAEDSEINIDDFNVVVNKAVC